MIEGDGPGISGYVPPRQEEARLSMLHFPQHPLCRDSASWLQPHVAHGWEQLIPAAAGLQPLALTAAAPGAGKGQVLLWCPSPWAVVLVSLSVAWDSTMDVSLHSPWRAPYSAGSGWMMGGLGHGEQP